MSASFEMINGVPNYNLYIGGQWTRSLRNETTESSNPATGELFARVQQAGAAETEKAHRCSQLLQGLVRDAGIPARGCFLEGCRCARGQGPGHH